MYAPCSFHVKPCTDYRVLTLCESNVCGHHVDVRSCLLSNEASVVGECPSVSTVVVRRSRLGRFLQPSYCIKSRLMYDEHRSTVPKICAAGPWPGRPAGLVLVRLAGATTAIHCLGGHASNVHGHDHHRPLV